MQRFRVATEIYYGPDSLGRLRELRGKRVLIITDAFMATSPIMERIRHELNGAEITVFDKVQPNPSVSDVSDGLRCFLSAAPEAVIALGGGSPIDTAKAVHKVARDQGNWHGLDCIVIPTTSGSGSEVTSFAVVTDSAHHKVPLTAEDMLPHIAILDPEAVRSAPKGITADTGMDAATHAIEAYVATGASDFSDAMAEKALQLSFAYLERAFVDGSDMEAREHLHNAATIAGLAFENAGLGIVHSLSHALGSTFRIAHGRANALLLPHVIEFNAGTLGFGPTGLTPVALRYAHLGHLLGVSGAPRQRVIGFINAVKKLNAALGMPVHAGQAGIDRSELKAAIPALAEAALHDFCTAGNPVKVTAADLAGILTKVA